MYVHFILNTHTSHERWGSISPRIKKINTSVKCSLVGKQVFQILYFMKKMQVFFFHVNFSTSKTGKLKLNK